MTLVTKSEEARIEKSIADAERRTSGEIIAMITAESSSYQYVAYLWAALIALALPWPFIYLTWWPVQHIYLMQVLVFLCLAGLFLWRPLRFWLVPRSVKRTRAHRRAVEQFLAQNLHTTSGRTGVLIFVSVAERYAEILADSAIHKVVPQTDWQAIVDKLTTAIGEGRPGDGFVTAIEMAGERLARHFPPGAIDPNQLPNHLIVLPSEWEEGFSVRGAEEQRSKA